MFISNISLHKDLVVHSLTERGGAATAANSIAGAADAKNPARVS
jgi:hypothetical protein